MTAAPRSTAQHLPEAVLRPVRGHHAFEACVEQLATAIRLGVYPRGTTLPAERELAERLQVSRATLREAMAALRQAGLVQTTRGRGGGTVGTMRAATPSAQAAARRTSPRRGHRGDDAAGHPVRTGRVAAYSLTAGRLGGHARLPPDRGARRRAPGRQLPARRGAGGAAGGGARGGGHRERPGR